MKITAKELIKAPTWKSRHDLPNILNDLKLLGTGVEIGVQRGVFGSHIRTHWNGNMYVGVDPWVKYFSVLDTQEMHDQYRADAITHLDATGKPYVLYRQTAMEFAESAARLGDKFDWIFVDGDHSYQAVMDEIEKFWPMLNPGGIFAAHDWVSDGYHRNGDPVTAHATQEAAGGDNGHCGIFEVQKAFYECFPVAEFASITSTDEDWGWPSIMFRKAI